MEYIKPNMIKKLLSIALILVASAICSVDAASSFPISNGLLQTPLNANRQDITNARTITVSNVTVQSLTWGGTTYTNGSQLGGNTNALTLGQQAVLNSAITNAVDTNGGSVFVSGGTVFIPTTGSGGSSAFFVSSTNVLVSTNAGTLAARGVWAWNGTGYTNHETLAYRNFVAGQWSTYTNGIEIYRGTNGAALGVTDTPIGGAGPGPGFFVGGYFTIAGYLNGPLITTNGDLVFNNQPWVQFDAIYSQSITATNLSVSGDIYGGTFHGDASSLFLMHPESLASGSLPTNAINTGPILPAQISSAVSNAVTATHLLSGDKQTNTTIVDATVTGNVNPTNAVLTNNISGSAASATTAGTTAFFATNGGPVYLSPKGNDDYFVIGDLNHPMQTAWKAFNTNCARGGGVIIAAPGYYEFGTNTGISTNWTQVFAYGAVFGTTNLYSVEPVCRKIVCGKYYEQWGGAFATWPTNLYQTSTAMLELSWGNDNTTNMLHLHGVNFPCLWSDGIGNVSTSTNNVYDIMVEDSYVNYSADWFVITKGITNASRVRLYNDHFYGDGTKWGSSFPASQGFLFMIPSQFDFQNCVFQTTNDFYSGGLMNASNVLLVNCQISSVSQPAFYPGCNAAPGSSYSTNGVWIISGTFTGNGAGLTYTNGIGAIYRTNAWTTGDLVKTNSYGDWVSNYVDIYRNVNVAGTIKTLKLGTAQ